MKFSDQQKAAAAYRRSGMSFRDIAKKLGVDKDRLRQALRDQGLSDGWGSSSPLKSASASISRLYVNGRR